MDIEYTIKRSSKRKNLTICIERDRSITILAPVGTSEEKIQKIVESKKRWISQKVNNSLKFDKATPPGKEVVNGEYSLYLGRSYNIEIVNRQTNEIEFDEKFYIPSHLTQNKGFILKSWYFREAQNFIIPRVKRIATSLGITYKEAKISNTRFQWGSCSPNGNLNFNWRLIKAPVFVIDYVIIHELAHILESNHSPDFWSIVRAHTPYSEKAKRWLLENGHLLEENL